MNHCQLLVEGSLLDNQITQDMLDGIDNRVSLLEAMDLSEKTVPIYDNHTRMPDKPTEVYSSTLCILKGIQKAVEYAAKHHYDLSLETVVLTVSTDETTDFRTIRQKEKSESRILLPAIALSLATYKFLYAPSNNIERFAKYYYNGTNYLTTYIAIPTEFKFNLRYYSTNYDQLLRFSESLGFNSQLGTKGEFEYDMLDYKGKVQKIVGYILIDADNSKHTPKQLTLKEKQLGQVWCISIPCYAWATIISKPYQTRAITTPQVNINLKPNNIKHPQKVQIDRFTNVVQEGN